MVVGFVKHKKSTPFSQFNHYLIFTMYYVCVCVCLFDIFIHTLSTAGF